MSVHRVLLLPLLLPSLALLACNARDGTETRTIELSYMQPGQALELVEPYIGSLAHVRATERPAALTISAPEAKLDQIEELLRRYDRPSPTVRLRFQLIEADGFTQTDPSIADVEAALRELFRFRGYRLIAEALATGSARSHMSQRMSGSLGRINVPLDLTVDLGPVSGDTGGTGEQARAVQLQVQLRAGTDVLLQSGVTVPHGQTVVLGTARPVADLGALILVVRPEIQ